VTLDTALMLGLSFLIAVPAIVFHEVAHGYVAFLLGDITAKSRGRLSLNPLRHIDPFGTVLLPILLIAMGLPGFGFAKPVPVNPAAFRDRRKGMFLTGIAGPATNLALAMVAGLLTRVVVVLFAVTESSLLYYVWFALYYFAFINLVLMFFNLIPLPPLDGSRVLPLFLSDSAMRVYHQWERYGFIILFGVLFLAPRFLGVDPLGVYLNWTVAPIMQLLTGLA